VAIVGDNIEKKTYSSCHRHLQYRYRHLSDVYNMTLDGPILNFCVTSDGVSLPSEHLLNTGYYELGDRNFALSVWPWITNQSWTTGDDNVMIAMSCGQREYRLDAVV